MKALKITFLLLAVVVLTVSGLSSDRIKTDDNTPSYKQIDSKELALIEKCKKRVPSNS